MDSQKQQIIEKLQAANNILVTVSSNPTVDQLAACIGMTLLLNKLDKHATAVFSGKIPSTIEFLKPEDTIEKNTDSLRDFIIALDKSKADKLRYKVEDKVVKIFITPYKTSLSPDDLIFSQGDFNVDIVLGLGIHEQTDLDQAITSHGRILHDATVMCINNTQNGELGTVNWQVLDASSLSELVVELAQAFEKPLLDTQISTALLTGIVAETDRFRNEKTTAITMNLSADLMTAGANQQLVAQELDHEIQVQDRKPSDQPGKSDTNPAQPPADTPPKPDDGMLEIDHEGPKPDEADKVEPPQEMQLPEPEAPDDTAPDLPEPEIHDEKPTGESAQELQDKQEEADEAELPETNGRALITEPPTMGGTLTANTQPENGDGVAMSMPNEEPQAPLLERDSHMTPPALSQQPTPDNFQETDLPSVSSPPAANPQPGAVPQPPAFSPPPMNFASPAPTTAMPPAPFSPPPAPAQPFTPTPFAPTTPLPAGESLPAPSSDHETLTQLEKSVNSPHVEQEEDVQSARDAVMKALNEQPDTALPPIEALNAQPVDLGKAPQMNQPLPPNIPEQAPFPSSPADQPMTMPMPPGVSLPPPQFAPPTNGPSNGPAPPPVPPPLPPMQ